METQIFVALTARINLSVCAMVVYNMLHKKQHVFFRFLYTTLKEDKKQRKKKKKNNKKGEEEL